MRRIRTPCVYVRIRDRFIGFFFFTVPSAKAAKYFRGFRKIVLSGHSLGGAAAYGTAKKRKDVKAVVALESPYLADIIGVDGNNFLWAETEYDCAMLNVYSDSGFSLVENDHKYVQNKKYLKNEDTVAYCYIKGANHYTLTDLARTSPLLCQILGGGFSLSGSKSLKIVNETTLNFLNKTLNTAGNN